jgi:uncharacterized protein (TIGR03032 family)
VSAPVFVVAAPGSGAEVLAEVAARAPGAALVSEEAIESVPDLHPANRGWDSNRLAPGDAGPEVTPALLGGGGSRAVMAGAKTALRIPFLAAAFPDARFVYLQRDTGEALPEAVAAWREGGAVTYPDLPGWDGPPWSFALTPEWRTLAGAELADVAAHQWRMVTTILLDDLEALPGERWAVAGHANLVAEPRAELERLCRFAGLDVPADAHFPTPARQATSGLSAAIQHAAPAGRRGRALVARPRLPASRAPASPLRSVSTTSLAQVLSEANSSLMLTTYQTGKVVAVAELNGGVNTHFRDLESPMGVAYADGRLAVGARSQVWDYRDVKDVAAKLDPPGRYDACFIPRGVRWTGEVQIHELAFAGGELWFVATRFSCLATLDDDHSFVPRWRPPFVSALAAEDRCHLNGMAVVGDEVRYVTALGATDSAGGWREDKAAGGVLLDVPSGETVAAGLSMPHSPRWHRDRLWVLESGQGTLATVDLDSGKLETVAEFPGFTRGLAFAGPLAFVGLSEVREATTFGGLPLTARLEERQCGVWVVNVESGELVGFLRFEELVEEIFEVALLPGIAFPEIAEHGSEVVNGSFVVPEGSTP